MNCGENAETVYRDMLTISTGTRKMTVESVMGSNRVRQLIPLRRSARHWARAVERDACPTHRQKACVYGVRPTEFLQARSAHHEAYMTLTYPRALECLEWEAVCVAGSSVM